MCFRREPILNTDGHVLYNEKTSFGGAERMKLRHFLIGAGIGIAAAVVVKQYVMQPYISSEKRCASSSPLLNREARSTVHGYIPFRKPIP